MKKLVPLILLFALLAFKPEQKTMQVRISLEGTWEFTMDPGKIGQTESWFRQKLEDSISLPGTMDEGGKGYLNQYSTSMHLNRIYTYEGAAWYRKKINIPEDFRGKHIILKLERTKPCMVWIDGAFAGQSRLLQSPQEYDLTSLLSPGEHTITLCIDNSLKLTPYGNVHIYTDETQTNWNGVLGEMFLEASDPLYISDIQVYPDITKKKIRVSLKMGGDSIAANMKVELKAERIYKGVTKSLLPKMVHIPFSKQPIVEYELLPECSLWDDYEQPLYHLTVSVSAGSHQDSRSIHFGMRSFSVQGSQFAINGRTTFLRGKHDGCVFPLTGHPPMDKDGWLRVFRIAKNYGINHYRFHSWCPPEAAFAAADETGLFLQVELPFWGGLDNDTLALRMKEEGLAMLKAYGNHPSFVMLSHGNEIWSGMDRVEKNLELFKQYDPRHLYTMGSNNGSGFIPPTPGSDYFVGARTPFAFDTILTHNRLTQAFVDSHDGGILNTCSPSTDVHFDYPVAHMKMPVMGHETGQYQIFPDFSEIKKYTGVLKPSNLEIFRTRLEKAGMMDQDSVFHQATGKWAALCYKAEMEAAVRTHGFAGYQLLDLQDYPGQGTALVGILDAFMDSKQVVTEKEWRQSCNDVTILATFPKYCWTNSEKFSAQLEVANYSNQKINRDLGWEINDESGNRLAGGKFAELKMDQGKITLVGEVSFDLAGIHSARKINLLLTLLNSNISNEYSLWIYPAGLPEADAGTVIETDRLTRSVLDQLESGKNVLLMPEMGDVKDHSIGGLFPPEFWNYGMFKGISENNKKPVSPGSMGILTNPSHPVFKNFPTDFYTNWQWFNIIKKSNPLILDATAKDYRPIIQVVDNLERNHKLGLLFEMKVGKGKLMVCMIQFSQIMDKPEAVSLYNSILEYMHSPLFDPKYQPGEEEMSSLFKGCMD